MELKGKMGWPAPTNAGGETYGTNIISVHVRKGDSCVAEGRVKKYGSCANFGRYERDSTPTKAYGDDVFNFVFLATDDDSTVKEARKDAKKMAIVFCSPQSTANGTLKTWEKNRVKYSKGMVKRDGIRHFKVGFIERRLGAGDGDPGRVGTETATDVELLASGDAFIGTFTSNLGQTRI